MAFQPSIVSNEAALSLKDPVCGMTVTPQSPHMLQHEGKPIYFCSAGCKGKFAANPAKYPFANFDAVTPALAPTPAMFKPVAAGAIYTCPMHPEVRQDNPVPAPNAAWRWSLKCPRLMRVRALN